MPTVIEQAQTLMSEGNAAQAEQLLQQALNLNLKKNKPNDTPALLSLLGHSLMTQKKLAEAIRTLDQMLSQHQPTASGYAQLAGALVSAGHPSQAEHAYRQAVELDGKFSEAWHLLGNLLMQRGERQQATHCFANAQKTDPFGHHFAAVKQHIDKGQYADAQNICQAILNRHPHHAQALYTLAGLASQSGAFEEAINILHLGLRYSPFHISLWGKLAENFAELGLYDKAVDACERLTKFDPNNPQHWINLGGNLNKLGQNEQSLLAYGNAEKLAPQLANIYLQKGHMLKILGKREACEAAYKHCLTIEKINGAAWWALADLKSYPFSDNDIDKMTALLKSNQTPAAQASQVAFALGKAFEDRQNPYQAFDYYAQANALRPDSHFDSADYAQTCQQIVQTFTPELLAKQATTKANNGASTSTSTSTSNNPTPIFIVGLPRSGSTLIEQILSSHSAIEGTMELFNLPQLIRTINIAGAKQDTPYPAALSLFNPQALRAFGQRYLDQTQVYRTDKPYFIDKAPANFHHIGLIQMILPEAIIIDARRHPLSTGFSNFKQHYASGHDFSYSLKSIGEYLNRYLDLMDHWDEVLPGKVLCAQYEDVVQDTEAQVRRLLTHCGLAFEENCLNFYHNKRAVRTSSSEQVRQPINQQGMLQWRQFEKQLTPLKQTLGETTLARFNAYASLQSTATNLAYK